MSNRAAKPQSDTNLMEIHVNRAVKTLPLATILHLLKSKEKDKKILMKILAKLVVKTDNTCKRTHRRLQNAHSSFQYARKPFFLEIEYRKEGSNSIVLHLGRAEGETRSSHTSV